MGLAEKFEDITRASEKPIKVWSCCSRKPRRKSCGCCFTILFGELKQQNILIQNALNAEHHWVKSSGCKLDCLFFKSKECKEETASDKPTFILCNANGMYCQQLSSKKRRTYLNFFLNIGIDVFIWNYRGYGRSQGSSSPAILQKDMVAVFNYLRNEMGIKGKIGVYARSLGGIPASYITPQVDMVIIDRSFCSLSELAYWKFYGRISEFIFRVGTCCWSVQNDRNFIKLRLKERNPSRADAYKTNDEESKEKEKSCYKIILTDKND